MILIPFESLRAFDRIPCSKDRSKVGAITYDEILARGNRRSCILAFLSHQWLSPSENPRDAHPDYKGLKHALLCEGLEQLAIGLPDLDEILLWIDYCCIDQHDDALRKIGLSNLPGYLERCDVLFTPYTDEIYTARGESTTIPEADRTRFDSQSEFPLFGRYRSLHDYSERAWCRLEMFMGTNAPMPTNGYEYFARLNVKNREDRPHLFYGTWQAKRAELPDPGPAISSSFFHKLRPEQGLLTLESDRATIHQLVATIDVNEVDPGYQGEVDGAGLPEGRGIKRYESGAVYDGEWKAGKHHGKGTFIYANGTRYVGDWRDDKRWGDGVHYLSNGLVFKGSYFEGDSHGPGRLYYQNGNIKYEGTKNRSAWEGPFREYYPSGALRYDGQAKDNKRHGDGTEYAEDGSVLRTGKWSNGNYVQGD